MSSESPRPQRHPDNGSRTGSSPRSLARYNRCRFDDTRAPPPSAAVAQPDTSIREHCERCGAANSELYEKCQLKKITFFREFSHPLN